MSERQHTTTALVVAGVTIHQDVHGRYNLNTLHDASGAGDAKKPGNWTKRASTKALQQELESQVSFLTLETVVGGNRAGTYAHELLAVEYAGWISPAFRIAVNQAFIDLRTGRLVPADTIPDRLPSSERAEVSEHLIAVWRLLRTTDVWLSNREIAQIAKLGNRAVRSYTRYLLDLGLIDVIEAFPRHLYRLSEQAERRHSGAFQRLEKISKVLEDRATYFAKKQGR